jgi:hypothetical protein
MPRVRVLDVRDAAVDLADLGGLVERGPDVRVHLARRVDVAHPVVALGMDAEHGERVDEVPGKVAGVGRVAVADRVRDLEERPAHLALDGVRRQERLGVHRVVVVDAVEELGLEAARAQGAPDRVEDDRPPEAAEMDGPRRRLRVVDDLGPAGAGSEFVSPILGRMASRSPALLIPAHS